MTHSLSISDARDAIESRRSQIKQWLTDAVAFQSVHSVPELQEHNDNAAQWVTDAFNAAGIPAEKHKTEDGSEAVIGLREPSEGMPTVLLYSHFDVQPATNTDEWSSDPWTLTERDGRWYGRGAADCKGNLVMHLAVLHALKDYEEQHPDAPKLGIRIVTEGSEERGGWGLDRLVDTNPELFAADAILIADSGNDKVGEPCLCTALRGSANVKVDIQTLRGPVHSGQYGGAAPDALLALIKLVDTLHDEDGLLTVDGLDYTGTWEGNQANAETFREDAGVLEGVEIYGEAGTTKGEGPRISDLTVARPAVTVTALDAVPTKDVINAVPAHASAWLNLRVPAGMDPYEAQDTLIAHLEKHVPWGAHAQFEKERIGKPFSANTEGPLHSTLGQSLADAYDKPISYNASGGSIPLCAKLLEAHPNAELALYGVEEPQCRIHSADESVDPEELIHTAIGELLFLTRFGRD